MPKRRLPRTIVVGGRVHLDVMRALEGIEAGAKSALNAARAGRRALNMIGEWTAGEENAEHVIETAESTLQELLSDLDLIGGGSRTAKRADRRRSR